MKRSFIILFVLMSTVAFSQEKDSVMYRYGFVLDFRNSFIDQIGFKYRCSNKWAIFIRGAISSRTNRVSGAPTQEVSDANTYFGAIGVEYRILKISNINLSPLLGYGITLDKYRYYIRSAVSGFAVNRTETHAVFIGIGTEYFLSEHFSVAGSQTAEYSYSTSDVPDSPTSSHTLITKEFNLVYARLSIGFYF